MDKPSVSARFFQASGWRVLDSQELIGMSHLALVVEIDYAIMGLIFLEDSGRVLGIWQDCQIELAKLKEERSRKGKIDLYLVFVVGKVAVDSSAALQEIGNDTHVCRKTFLVQGTKTIEETISELPFFKKGVVEAREEPNLTSMDSESPTLPDAVLRDLGHASSATVLENLLAGKYKRNT